MPFFAPPLPEQRAIAAFLDRETVRIDALVAAKERLIALLREKRAALINHAITYGLNPVSSLGQISVSTSIRLGWTVLPLKRWVSVKITDGPHETPDFVDEGVPFISAEAVQNSQIDFAAARYITPEAHRRYCQKAKPKLDDILLCKAGATTGKLALVDVDFDFSIWSPLALIRADIARILSRFLFFALHTSYVQDQIKQASVTNTQPNIGMGVIERLAVPAPDVETQARIVAYLDRETAKLDALIAKVQRHIEKVKEYRAALIAAAVTGKIDVREEEPANE